MHPSYRTGIDRTIQDVGGRNRSAKPWKNSRSASSPQRSSHIAPVSPLSHQRSGWTTLPTGQPRYPSTRMANRRYRSDTTGLISAFCPQSRWRWTLRPLLGRHGGQACRRSSPRLDRTVASGRLAPTEWRPLSEPPFRFPHRRRDLRSLRRKSVQEAFRGALPCQGVRKSSLPGKAGGFRGVRTPSKAMAASMSSGRRSSNGSRKTRPPTAAKGSTISASRGQGRGVVEVATLQTGDSPPFVKRWKPVSYGLPSLASILAGSRRTDHGAEASASTTGGGLRPREAGSGSSNPDAVRVEAGAVTQHGTGDVEEPIGHRTQGARMTVAAGA